MASTENSTVTVTVSSSNGYSDTIGFGCGTLPAGVTCHFGSDKIALKAGGTANVQLTIDTNTPLNGGSTVMNTGAGGNGFSLAGLFFPAGLMFGWIGWRFRKKNSVVFGAVLAVLFSGMMMMTGCGGFSQKSATPGTYSIQITGIGSSSNISHYQTVTLTITK
jgi:LPXTG-motif cell wall-anchored protein